LFIRDFIRELGKIGNKSIPAKNILDIPVERAVKPDY